MNQPAEKPEFFWEGIVDQTLAADTEKLIREQLAKTAANPNDPRPYCHLGMFYYMLGRVDEAIAMHEQALARDASFALSHQHLGQIYVVLGQYEKAWAHARRAAERGNTVLLDMLSRYPTITQPPEGQ